MPSKIPMDWLRGKEETPEAQKQRYEHLYRLAEWAYGWVCNFPSRSPEEEEARQRIARELGDFLYHPINADMNTTNPTR